MSKYDELKRLVGELEVQVPALLREKADLIAENERLTSEVRALEEKTAELNFDAARYCYLATTTWSDEVTDALCTSDKGQIDQAVDAELMRAAA